MKKYYDSMDVPTQRIEKIKILSSIHAKNFFQTI